VAGASGSQTARIFAPTDRSSLGRGKWLHRSPDRGGRLRLARL